MLRAPVRIVLARGQTSAATSRATVNLQLDTLLMQESGIVVDQLRYDVILGQPWLRKWNPSVNWTTGEYKWTINGRRQTVQGEESKAEKNVERERVGTANVAEEAANATDEQTAENESREAEDETSGEMEDEPASEEQ
ncbi:hypothetical protein BGW38_010540, partial [Lunasporangiospora selenospora]